MEFDYNGYPEKVAAWSPQVLFTHLPLLYMLLFPVWFCLALFSASPLTEWPSEAKNALLTDTTDITEQVREQVKALPGPPTVFRQGQVTPASLKDYLSRTDNGYRIQLPHRGLTPTPTLWEDLALVSGGFGSKSFFAFEQSTGALAWAISLDDDGPSNGAVADGILVFNTESCTIFAVEARTGKPLWSWWLGDPLMSAPAIANGIVYTAYPARPGTAAEKGNQQEQNQLPAHSPLSVTLPASDQKWSPSHVLAAFELKTGALVWQHWIDGDVMTAPAVVGDEVLVTTFSGTVYQFRAMNGELLKAESARATSAPTFAGGALRFSRRTDTGASSAKEGLYLPASSLTGITKSIVAEKHALYLDEQVQNTSKLKSEAMSQDAGNGFSGGAPAAANWSQAAQNVGLSNVSSLQAFQGSRMLCYEGRSFATMGDEIVCASDATGEIVWRHALSGDLRQEGGSLGAPPFVAGGRLVTAGLDGTIWLHDPATGKLIESFDVEAGIRAQPVAMNGWLFVTTITGELVAIQTAAPGLTGWPTLAGNAARTNAPAP